jgi:uncharacterized linocin/CFP29 family protein
MTDILKRKFAPLTDEAWKEIDKQATEVIEQNLCGRRLVDISGPHGSQYGAVDLGRLQLADKPAEFGVQWGMREVLSLIEVRSPFVLSHTELDNVGRGSRTPKLGSVQHAAEQIARFEDMAIFMGFAPGQINGMAEGTTQKAMPLPRSPAKYPDAVSAALKKLSTIGVGGPYDLVLGPDEYFGLLASNEGFPPRQIIEEMTGGKIALCLALVGGLLLSVRGGDFELTIGQDLAVGYHHHDDKGIQFFLTESFTFRTLESAAAVQLTRPKKRTRRNRI